MVLIFSRVGLLKIFKQRTAKLHGPLRHGQSLFPLALFGKNLGQIVEGAAVYFQQFKLPWTQVLRTKEYDEQHGNHTFGSLTLSFFF